MQRIDLSEDDNQDYVNGSEDGEISVVNVINNASFTEWYRERERVENIQAGRAYFNGPPSEPDSFRHRPSLLLRCHRYAYYKRRNAPRESGSPDGLFWFGSKFEEEVIVPFLQDVSPDHLFVQNSVWTSSTIDVEDVELVVKGMTDPVLVTDDGEPVLVTEIKTSSSVEYRSDPAEHHKAQIHSYLFGLQSQYDREIPGVIVYISRDTLDLKAFSVDFDAGFWMDVVGWMRDQTGFEDKDELPPASPRQDWECKYCDYKNRCGKGSEPFQDLGTEGLLTLHEYPKESVKEYLQSHDDGLLTPTLAHLYPELVHDFDVADWACPACSTHFHWRSVEWDGETDSPPMCPDCLQQGDLTTLSGEQEY